MKLTLVGPVYPYRGGISTFTTQLGQNLISAGHSVQIISFSRQYPAWLYPGKTDKDPSHDHPEVQAYYLLDPLYPWTWLRAAREISTWQPELVLIQWWTTFWGPAFFCLSKILRARRLPVVYTIHNVIPHEARFFDRWIVTAALSTASACIPLSPQEGERLRDLLPSMPQYPGRLPVSRITSIRLSKSEARQRLNLDANIPVILFFGIVRPYKGLAVLIEALGLLKNAGCYPHLLIAGEFWEDESTYQAQVDRLGLSTQVHIDNRFLPNEEVGAYFSAADLFVAPYVGGTQSGAIKNAMDYGIPVLASDRIASDLPVDTYPVLIHPAGDAAALANSIQSAIQSRPTIRPSSAGSDGWIELADTIQLVRDQCWPK